MVYSSINTRFAIRPRQDIKLWYFEYNRSPWMGQSNISLFGGDPNNVTILEVAGGHNVLSLLVAKQAKGLFHKAISQSGYTTHIQKKMLTSKQTNLQHQSIQAGMLLIRL